MKILKYYCRRLIWLTFEVDTDLANMYWISNCKRSNIFFIDIPTNIRSILNY